MNEEIEVVDFTHGEYPYDLNKWFCNCPENAIRYFKDDGISSTYGFVQIDENGDWFNINNDDVAIIDKGVKAVYIHLKESDILRQLYFIEENCSVEFNLLKGKEGKPKYFKIEDKLYDICDIESTRKYGKIYSLINHYQLNKNNPL